MEDVIMTFNEDSRVKIPITVHFRRLGYTYQTKKRQNIQCHNNIFVDVFKNSMKNINGKDYSDEQLDDAIKQIEILTDNRRDKGKGFYERLKAYNDMMLVNLDEPCKNDFRVVTELPFRGERDVTFRPDITILVNGIPMAFVEAKKPNNKDGIQAEFKRMKEERVCKDELVPFFNQLQVLGFTNNQPYNDKARTMRQGSFYTTPNGKDGLKYNHFREEQEVPISEYISEDDIQDILSDNNIMSIRDDAEFKTNLRVDTPANKFITSLFSKERFIYFLKYGIVYVDSPVDGYHKHIIRYPQYFGLQALEHKIDNGMKRGVLWHTQGSGKTAFSYFATNVLRDYYQKKDIITKFYFVVDRLDLLRQATAEFSARGMTIAAIDSKEDFVKNMQSQVVIDAGSSQSGKYQETMNVVNIQKFSDESVVIDDPATDVQRIYFLDEVHRGYKPKGTFLGNLLGADPNGIFIGLTGTPILNSDFGDEKDGDGKKEKHTGVKRNFKTTDIFHEYIHKYYYNKSIADGYTLKIKKENIDTKFRNDIRDMIGIPEGQAIPAKVWEDVTKAQEYVDQLCRYIVKDFEMFEDVQHDDTMGFMVVASSSDQARAIQKWFEDNTKISTALVLHDTEDNKHKQEYFRGKKDNATGETIIKYKGVIVFNMLLTGFDAPRLKRLYLLRTIREHNLLQTLARVNRPYKNMRYGYVVDFVDITAEYEDINRRYLEELRSDLEDGDGKSDVDDMFVDVEAVKKKVQELENQLFIYMGNIENNLESFRKQIEVLDEETVRQINRALAEYRECYNELRMSHEDVSDIPIDRIIKAQHETSHRIEMIVAERMLDSDDPEDEEYDFTNLIVEFLKRGEIDLDFTSENDIMELISKFNNARSANTDKKDPVYLDIYKRYKQLIKDFKKNGDTTDKVKQFMQDLESLTKEMLVLNENNNSLTNRYKGSEEYMRIHKRLLENYSANLTEVTTFNLMQNIIAAIDDLLGHMGRPTQNVVIRELLRPVRDALRKQGFPDTSRRQVENVINVFIDDKFSK